MLKYDFYKIVILLSNATIADVALRDLYLYFQGKTFHVTILTGKR